MEIGFPKVSNCEYLMRDLDRIAFYKLEEQTEPYKFDIKPRNSAFSQP